MFMFASIDNILALTVDGKTVITYNETDPFAINYFAFTTILDGHEAQYYYNCKTKQSIEVSLRVQL